MPLSQKEYLKKRIVDLAMEKHSENKYPIYRNITNEERWRAINTGKATLRPLGHCKAAGNDVTQWFRFAAQDQAASDYNKARTAYDKRKTAIKKEAEKLTDLIRLGNIKKPYDLIQKFESF